MDIHEGKERDLKAALVAFEKNGYNGIALKTTGSGKGRLMIDIAKKLDPPTILYLCNTQGLRDSMFIDELHKWDAAYLIPRITFACYQTAYKWVGKHWGLLLGDEFDAALTPEYIKAIKNNTFDNKILVSATLDEAKRKMAEKIAPIVYEKTVQESINEKVVNEMQFYFINFDLNKEENSRYLEFNNRFKTLLNQPQTKQTKYLLEKVQIARKHFLSGLKTSENVVKWLLGTLAPANEKVLIFCGLSSQADKVCKYSYHSLNDNKQALHDFEAGIIKELAVVDKLSRGMNITEIKNVVHESVGSSKTRMTQRNGRGLRLKIGEILNVFFLIPHFIHPYNGHKPTIVQDWVDKAIKDIDYKHAKYINYKP